MCHETASQPEVKNAWSASYPVTGSLQERNGRDGNTSYNVERPVARHGLSSGRQQSHGGDGARAAGSSGRGTAQKGTKIVAQFDPSGVGLEAQRYEFDAPAPAERLVPVGEVEQAVDGARRDDYEDRSGGGGPTGDKPRWQALEEFRVKNFDGAEFSTGSPEALTEFVEWAADHDTIGDMRYLLVLSGHGGGTSNDFLLKDENAQDALSMEELQTSLTESLKELRRRLKNPDRKFDILGFDACSMSMGEVRTRFETLHTFSSAPRGSNRRSGGRIDASSPTLRHEPTTRTARRWRPRSSRGTSRIITITTARRGAPPTCPRSIWTRSRAWPTRLRTSSRN